MNKPAPGFVGGRSPLNDVAQLGQHHARLSGRTCTNVTPIKCAAMARWRMESPLTAAAVAAAAAAAAARHVAPTLPGVSKGRCARSVRPRSEERGQAEDDSRVIGLTRVSSPEPFIVPSSLSSDPPPGLRFLNRGGKA